MFTAERAATALRKLSPFQEEFYLGIVTCDAVELSWVTQRGGVPGSLVVPLVSIRVSKHWGHMSV